MPTLPPHFMAPALLAEPSRWLLWAPVLLGLGIGGYFAWPTEPPAWVMTVALLPALLWLLGRWAWTARLRLQLGLAALAWVCLGFGAAQLTTATQGTPQLDWPLGPVTLTGTLQQIEQTERGWRLTLVTTSLERLSESRWPKLVRVTARAAQVTMPLTAGDQLQLLVRLNPLSSPVAPDAHDFRRQGFFAGLGGIGWALSPITKLPATTPPSDGMGGWARGWQRALQAAEQWRERVAATINAQLSGDVAAISATLLNGEQASISAATLQAMRASGLQHILSISGLHLAVVAALAFVVLRQLLALLPWLALYAPIKKIAAAAALLIIVVYTFATGLQWPTIRAMLMAGLVFVAVMFDRRALTLRTLALAALFILLLHPPALLQVSFQLSFAAMLGLLAWYERAQRQPPAQLWHQKIGQYLVALIVTSLLASIFTTPLTIYHFQTFSIYGVVANLVGVPLTSLLIMPLALLFYVLDWLGVADGVVVLLGFAVGWLIEWAKLVASWPGALQHWPAPAPWALLAIVLGALWLTLWQQGWRWWGIFPIIMGVVGFVLAAPPPVLVAAGGRIMGWVEAGTLQVSGATARNFVVAQWAQRAGGLPVVEQPKIAVGPIASAVASDQSLALWQVREVAGWPAACANAQLILTPLPVASAPTECTSKRLGQEFWAKHGAAALWPTPTGWHVRVAAPALGQRPWQPAWRGEAAADFLPFTTDKAKPDNAKLDAAALANAASDDP